MKSVYIGGMRDGRSHRQGGYPYRMLAYHFHELIQEYGVKRTRTVKGKKQTYYIRPKGGDTPIDELEQAILSCIDIEKVVLWGSDMIDHEKLQDLQDELFPGED